MYKKINIIYKTIVTLFLTILLASSYLNAASIVKLNDGNLLIIEQRNYTFFEKVRSNVGCGLIYLSSLGDQNCVRVFEDGQILAGNNDINKVINITLPNITQAENIPVQNNINPVLSCGG
jgi:hypothetical protein